MFESIDWWGLGQVAGAAVGASWLTHWSTVRLYERKRRDLKSDELRNAYAEWYSYVDMGQALLREQAELLGAVTKVEEFEAAISEFKRRVEGKDYVEINRKANEQYALILQIENSEERLTEVEELSDGRWWREVSELDEPDSHTSYPTLAAYTADILRKTVEGIEARERRATKLLRDAR